MCLSMRMSLLRHNKRHDVTDSSCPSDMSWGDCNRQARHYRSHPHLVCFLLHSCCIIVSAVGWTWRDWNLILWTYLPSVLWRCWLGHLTRKNPSPIWPIMWDVKPYSINQSISCVSVCVRSWRVHSVCPAWQQTLCSTTSPRWLCCRHSQPCSPSSSASSSNSTRSRCEPNSTWSTLLWDSVIGIVHVSWKLQSIAAISLLDAVMFRFRPFVYSAFANVLCSVQTSNSSIRMCYSASDSEVVHTV